MSKYFTDKRLGTIYKIQNKINGKIYIGQTIMNVKDRWYRHCEFVGVSKAEMDMPIKRAIKKYGKQSFIFSVLEKVKVDLLNEREKYWIDYYNSYNCGYNATLGGNSNTHKSKLLDKESEIIDLYIFGFSTKELGKEYKVDKKTIKTILLKHGISIRKTSNSKHKTEELNLLISLYNEGYSRKYLCNTFKISKGYISKILKEYNLSKSVQILTSKVED